MQADRHFRLQFVKDNQTFDVTFQERTHPSKDTVRVNERNYALQGDSFNIAWLKAQLPELTQSGLSSDSLRKRLIQLGATHISSTAKTHKVGKDSFNSHILVRELAETHPMGKWMAKEAASLPSKRKARNW